MTPQERLDFLLETVQTPTNAMVTFSTITDALGGDLAATQATALVVGTMKAGAATNPLLDTVVIAMSNNGISLSSPVRQTILDQLAVAGEWPDAMRGAIKALGVLVRPRWQIEGYVTEPTLADMETEVTKATLRQTATDRWNAFIDAMDAWDGSGDEPVL